LDPAALHAAKEAMGAGDSFEGTVDLRESGAMEPQSKLRRRGSDPDDR
jgi:hypothetical protein